MVSSNSAKEGKIMPAMSKRTHFRAPAGPLFAQCGLGRNWPIGQLKLTSDAEQVTCSTCKSKCE